MLFHTNTHLATDLPEETTGYKIQIFPISNTQNLSFNDEFMKIQRISYRQRHCDNDNNEVGISHTSSLRDELD